MALSSTGQIQVTRFFLVLGRIGRFSDARSTEGGGGMELAPQGGMERELKNPGDPVFPNKKGRRSKVD